MWLQEEEALLNEMEVTGQAFEDMQEQNSRLIQQLREKDDANFKLMTERIKSNQLHKLARFVFQDLEFFFLWHLNAKCSSTLKKIYFFPFYQFI